MGSKVEEGKYESMKILFITSSYDKIGSASVRNISLTNGLIENNCEVDVLTQFWPKSMVDLSIKEYIDPRINVYRDHIKVIDTFFSNKRWDEEKKEKKIVGVVKELLRQFYFFPDIDKEWIYSFNKHIEYNKYDLIISSSDTKTSHFIAKKIAKKYGIKWFSYWGDPWEDDMGTKGIKKIIARHFERILLEICDCNFYTSEPTLYAMKKKYPHISKMYFLKRAYMSEIIGEKYTGKKYIKVNYCGSIYYGRNIDIFIDKINRFNSSDERKVKIDFYGIYPYEFKKQYENDYVKFYGLVDHRTVDSLLKEADILLMIMNDSASHQIPGKLFDYFGTNKCILVLASDNKNIVEQFIESTNRCKIFHNDNMDISKLFEWLNYQYEPVKDYCTKNVAKELLDHYYNVNFLDN